MKTLPLIVFALAAVGQWALPLFGIWQHEQVLAKGALIKLKCTAPDPYDPLRGRFLAVSPEQRDVSIGKDMAIPKGRKVYAILTTGADGLAHASSVSLIPPADGDYMEVKVGYSYSNDSMTIEWPFDRFYINEKLGPEADKWFAENIRSAKGIIAEVRVLKGQAVLQDLSVDGRPVREIVKERLK